MRPDHLKESIKMFMAQSVKDKELVIVDDSPIPLDWRFPKGVWYHYIGPKKRTIGYKMNVAVGLSKGDIIAFWDDDDFYGPKRLRNQRNHMMKSGADITVYSHCMNIEKGKRFILKKEEHDKLWKHGYVGPTIMFRRSVKVPFKRTSLAEDSLFLKNAMKMHTLSIYHNYTDFMYHRHNDNTWKW